MAHGGASPAARIKAEQMLAIARLPACEALYTIIDRWSADVCGTCGFPSGDNDETRTIIRACQVILDRSGIGPRATLELAPQADGDVPYDLMTVDEQQHFAYLVAEFQALKATIRARLASVMGHPVSTPVLLGDTVDVV